MATDKQIAFIMRLVNEIEDSPYLKRPEFDDSPRGVQAKSIWEQTRRDWMLCTMAAYDVPAVEMPYDEVHVLFRDRVQEVKSIAPALSTKQASWLIDELKRGVLPDLTRVSK